MHSEPGVPAASSLRIPVDVRRLPWVRRLAADYAHDFVRLASFFAGDPASPDAWHDTIRRTQAHARPRAAAVEVLRSQQQRRNAPAEARAATARLADERAIVVVTGQQAGLFGGPLFTLLKALTALKLAGRLTREHGVPAVAVFWIDAEDHDWDEVESCGVLDAELEWRAVTLPRPERAGEAPVASVSLDGSIGAVIEALGALLPASEFTRPLLDDLRAAYHPGAGMADAFGLWLETVLGRHGLVVFDCADPAAKPLASAVFERELRRPGRTAELAAAAGAELVARGYHAQVTPHADSVALFYLDGERRPVRRRDAAFVVGEAVRSPGELLEEALTRPARFSPNVLLRPIVQDTIFPTACYVAGPSELAYLAQLRQVYEHFGVPMPLIFPRASATIVDAAAARFLTRHELPFETLQPQDEAALNRLLESHLPEAVERAMEDAGRAVRERMESVIAAVPAIDPTLAGAARSTLGRMEHDLGTLHNKIIQAAKRRDETLRRQFKHTRAQTFPAGHPQERAVGFVYFLNQYGPALVDRVADELPLDLGRHWILTI